MKKLISSLRLLGLMIGLIMVAALNPAIAQGHDKGHCNSNGKGHDIGKGKGHEKHDCKEKDKDKDKDKDKCESRKHDEKEYKKEKKDKDCCAKHDDDDKKDGDVRKEEKKDIPVIKKGDKTPVKIGEKKGTDSGQVGQKTGATIIERTVIGAIEQKRRLEKTVSQSVNIMRSPSLF